MKFKSGLLEMDTPILTAIVDLAFLVSSEWIEMISLFVS